MSEWLMKHLKPLVGATITRVEAEPDPEGFSEPWPVLYVKLADGTQKALVIQRDPEGNGPGHVEFDDVVEKVVEQCPDQQKR